MHSLCYDKSLLLVCLPSVIFNSTNWTWNQASKHFQTNYTIRMKSLMDFQLKRSYDFIFVSQLRFLYGQNELFEVNPPNTTASVGKQVTRSSQISLDIFQYQRIESFSKRNLHVMPATKSTVTWAPENRVLERERFGTES